jgi:DNA-binding transcriptional LysR family regulator
MDLDGLGAFVAFSDCLNFTHAAERLAISQPALHVKIKKLASELQVPLYSKRGRRLYLTPQGEELARFGRETLATTDAFIQSLRGASPETPVTLIAGSGAYLYLLGEAIRTFREQVACPLRLMTGDRAQTLETLRTGKAQLGVTVLRNAPEDLVGELLCSVTAKVVVRAEHPLARRRSLSLLNLEGQALIVPPAQTPFRETLETYLKQAGVHWRLALEASGWPLMMQFVRLGLGITVVNGCCDVPSSCRAIPLKGFPGVDYYLLRHQRTLLDGSRQALRQAILTAGRQQR